MRPLLVGLMLCVMPIATEAQVTTRTIAQAGGWTAFAGSTNDGSRTCGIDASHVPSGRHFLMQWIEPENVLHVRMVRTSWQIPDQTPITVALRIDGNPAWTASAVGAGVEVRWRIAGSNVLNTFEREFRRGVNMVIAFQTGNESPWSFSLIGTNAIMNAFVSCLQATNSSRTPTQPFSPAPPPPAPRLPPTQPFSSGTGTRI